MKVEHFRYSPSEGWSPREPGSPQDVVGYNISYLYFAGLRTDEAVLVKPAPLWGDETNGPDTSTDAFYMRRSLADAARTQPGHYAKIDNHSDKGGSFVFSDGHGDFITGNVHWTFFSDDDNTNAQSINLFRRNRSQKVQTLD